MTGNQKKNSKKSGSLIWRAINLVTSAIYTFFFNSEIMRSNDTLYKKSAIAQTLEKNTKVGRAQSSNYIEFLLEKSRVLRALGKIQSVLASMSLNVYGIFFTAYALTSAFMYYIVIVLNGKNDNGISAIIAPIVILICSIPMMLTNRSVSNVVADSKIMRSVVLSFFAIPEEKLRSRKTYGGTEFMFMIAILAVLLGIFTYFIHPLYVPAICCVIILFCLISSNPETGVMITIASAPFLQYTAYSNEILGAMIIVTMISYIGKIIRRRRTVSFSSESVLVLLFCGFIIVESVFSVGGSETLREAIYSVIIIMGGFFLTYNLMRGKKNLTICSKIMQVSFLVICIFGVWNYFYNGIVERNVYSLHDSVSPIFENNTIYIADSASVFSVLAVLLFPLMISYATKQKSVKGIVLAVLLTLATVASVFIYGYYEAVVAIILELFIFWLLYSHKSLSALLIILVPLVTVVVGYPFIAQQFGLPELSAVVARILPLSDANSSYRADVTSGVIQMLKDGNLSGIGVGTRAFDMSYSSYSNAVSADALNPGSFWLQLVCWSGIGGAVCFVLLAVTLTKKGLGYGFSLKKREIRGDMLALLCGITVSLVFGAVNCIWSDPRMLYLFWVCVGLLSGYIKDSENLDSMISQTLEDDVCGKEIELNFYKNY